MSISEQHVIGLRDLLVNERNIPILLQLAKSVTRNVCSVEQPEEALGYLIAHMEDINKLLHKRHITRELLFKYLHTRMPGTSTDFSKADLVMRVIKYWDQQQPARGTTKTVVSSISTTTDLLHRVEDQSFPIHLIARKFGEWFFEKYNTNSLTLTDLWCDAALHLKVIADDGANELECVGDADVLDSLVKAKQTFGFYFNPNLSHSGVQGRMDPYGQVVVLCCGTLHTEDRSVGIFECCFGLLRDPHACNNWKPKKFKCLLRSELSPPTVHTLTASDTLQEALALPTPSDTLD